MANPVGLTNTAAPAPTAPPTAPPARTHAHSRPRSRSWTFGSALGSAAVGALQSASDHENTDALRQLRSLRAKP